MKKVKQIGTIILALAISAFAFVGCANDSTETNSGDSSSITDIVPSDSSDNNTSSEEGSSTESSNSTDSSSSSDSDSSTDSYGSSSSDGLSDDTNTDLEE